MSEEGRPLQIIKSVDDNFVFEDSDLLRILDNDEIKDHFIVVVSVAGAFRKGKSFLLGFFIRYLNAMYKKKDASNWIGNSDEPLEGFSWKNGPNRDTTGVLMWSEVFLHEDGDENIAIVLLDTQGVFDGKTSQKNCAVIFALSALLSSVQIYNLSENIQEDDFQNLQLFTEYGRLALKKSIHKPFQELVFLVRDWYYAYTYEYGPIGGNRLLHTLLQINDNQPEELSSVRKHLKNCFSNIECFLMPHPGLEMVQNENFNGKLDEISEEFLEQLKILVHMVLSPTKLKVKEVNGEKVRFKELVRYFKVYLNVLTGDELPEPMSVLNATADVDHLKILSECKEIYEKEMRKICNEKELLTTEDFRKYHDHIKSKLLEQFDNKKKMGGPKVSLKYREQLSDYLDKLFGVFNQQNNFKNENSLVTSNYSKLAATIEAKEYYSCEMEEKLKSNTGLKSEDLLKFHNKIKSKAIEKFIKVLKQINVQYQSFLDDLNKSLEELFEIYKTQNETSLVASDDKFKEKHMDIIYNITSSYAEYMNDILDRNANLSSEALEIAHLKISAIKMKELTDYINDKSNLIIYSKILEDFLDNNYKIFKGRFFDKLKSEQYLRTATNLNGINEARKDYTNKMNALFLHSDGKITLEVLADAHNHYRNEAIQYFQTLKVDGDTYFDKYLCDLLKSIDEVFSIYQMQQRKYSNSWFTTIKEMCLPLFENLPNILGVLANVIAALGNLRRGRFHR